AKSPSTPQPARPPPPRADIQPHPGKPASVQISTFLNARRQRGYDYIVIEPWTSYPNKLAEAVQQNTHRILRPGERFSVELAATFYGREEGYQGALRAVAQ
ncbi:MAG: hypothetical protein ABSF71_40315, partial [Terriglobia bacterium]